MLVELLWLRASYYSDLAAKESDPDLRQFYANMAADYDTAAHKEYNKALQRLTKGLPLSEANKLSNSSKDHS